ALDRLLNRYVAVKVLRQQFVHDEEFIRRFGREAQSAASLSHPNVVSIYDVGREDDIHFIVMEYIEGRNLNEIIKERAPLQADESVRIAIQICDALDHAHQHHIIHRDIKPHNILIGNNGRVKVTDFGIARAVTSSTITQTGSVLGSVHYFSPEHAKGVSTGEKSDLYSLGIVLYQMVTGKLPFLGESPISVALKHLQEPFEEPRLVNPLIPQSVENVILKSMRKNPAERYQSAKEMLDDLETCLQPNRLHEPKISFAHAASFDDDQETRVMPAIRMEEEESRMPVSRSGGAGTAYAASGASARNPRERSTGGGGAQPPHKSDDPQKKWVKPTIWITATLVLLGILIGVVFYVKALLDVKEVKVPNLINMTEQQAIAELAKWKLEIELPIIREPKEGFEKGVVFNQIKAPGSMVKEGSSIKLYVSEGEPKKAMLDLKGLSYDEAVAKLLELGVERSRINSDPVYDDEAAPDMVVDSIPAADAKFDPKTDTVKLMVSKGPEPFNMPNLVDKTEAEALAELEKNGLKLKKDGIIREPSYRPEGVVIDQKPYEPNDPVTKGSEVLIYVSSGYPPEALKYTFNLPVAPKEEGKETEIRIEFSDARGDKQDGGKQKITTAKVFAVNLVLAPDKDAVVSVYRNGEFFDAYPIRYSDAKQGTVPIPEINPATTDPVTEPDPGNQDGGGTDPGTPAEGEGDGAQGGGEG
ncbi:Stk1 family PASTA domain-containing Ser/Thr kinase, partial [Paenibacillus marinisediminis]